MRIFSEIQGKQPEPLASTVLCRLMQESTAICSAVLEAINESIATQSSHTSPLGLTRRFAARLEVPVPSDSDQRGTSYLDILMETDDAAVGIEAKFWAQFQPDQPKKYLSVVEKAKKALSDMPPPSDARGVLVVLAPEGKLAGGEAKERIREADVAGSVAEIPCIGVPWERTPSSRTLARPSMPNLGDCL